jgi:hypothetical protein
MLGGSECQKQRLASATQNRLRRKRVWPRKTALLLKHISSTVGTAPVGMECYSRRSVASAPLPLLSGSEAGR